MRILLSGALNPRFEALPEYLAAALRGLGHQVVLFDHRSFMLPGRLRARVPLLDRLERNRLNARLLGLVRRQRPGLVIVNQGMVLEGRTIETIRAEGTRCVNWFSDFPAEFQKGLAVAPCYDAFFLGSSYAAGRHRDAGHRNASWLPFGCDPHSHRPEEPGDRAGSDLWSRPSSRAVSPSIVFVGSYYPERQILLRFLRGLPVGVWGPGWERATDDPHVAPMIRGGTLRPSTWRLLYARCRVALNIHYGSFGPLDASGDLANTRVFEILGCGAYQVVDRQGDVLRLFTEGQHLAAFSSGEELRARVEQALQDDPLRESVARRGREEVLARHTYEHRALRLLDPRATAEDAGHEAGGAAGGTLRQAGRAREPRFLGAGSGTR
jgi:spore maturation protein CgeB